MNTQTRFINRMGDHVRTGDYGCALTRPIRERMPAHEKALYIVSAFAVAVVAMAVIFN